MKLEILLSIILLSSSVFAYKINDTCQIDCNCDLTQNSLTVLCNQPITSFTLPDKSADPNLFYSSTIIARVSFLHSFPTNLCAYSTYLNYLDLSVNVITSNITKTTFSCLNQLRVLNLSSNALRNIDATAFDLTYSLTTIDLSQNRIQILPVMLFPGKLPHLQYLYLQNNFIEELDPWYFALPMLNRVDLTSNLITKFTNYLNFDIYNQTYNLNLQPQINLLDLRGNRMFKFDDNTLKEFQVCTSGKFNTLLRLFYGLRIEDNQFHCSCVDSFNLLSNYKELSLSGGIQSTNPIFQTRCKTPNILNSQSIFSFVDPSTCNTTGIKFNDWNCPVYVQTTTKITTSTIITASRVGENRTVNNPGPFEAQIAEGATEEDTTGTIAHKSHITGIVVGFFGLLALIIALLYCVFPIEINAILFNLFPFFFRCCPCKSSCKSNKPYDLFISYNKSSAKWIAANLIPFLETRELTYFLHYDESFENCHEYKDEVFGQFIKEKMDNSAFILLVLSDQFLINEWENKEFREYVKNSIVKVAKSHEEKTRLLCIQLPDVSDEEVDDYIRDKLQIPQFTALETDEFFFWQKLGYFLYVNRDRDDIVPVHDQTEIELNMRDRKPKIQPNDLLNFKRHDSIEGPIIHVPSDTNSHYDDRNIKRSLNNNKLNSNRSDYDYTPEIVQQSILSQLAYKKNNRINDNIVVNLDDKRIIVNNKMENKHHLPSLHKKEYTNERHYLSEDHSSDYSP